MFCFPFSIELLVCDELELTWILLNVAAYCVVAVESAGRQIPIAFLERIKEEFSKKYAGGKAANAAAKSLNKEFGYLHILQFLYC